MVDEITESLSEKTKQDWGPSPNKTQTQYMIEFVWGLKVEKVQWLLLGGKKKIGWGQGDESMLFLPEV